MGRVLRSNPSPGRRCQGVGSSVNIMVHLAWGGQNVQSRAFLDKALAQGVEFEILDQSYHGVYVDLEKCDEEVGRGDP